MSMTDAFISIAKALRPSMESDPMIQYQWRRAVATSITGMMLIGGASVAWAQGWIPNVSGVALASSVEELAQRDKWQFKKINDHIQQIEEHQRLGEILSLEEAIRTQRTTECEAQRSAPPNEAAARLAADTLDRYLSDYRRLAGYDLPHLPDCGELVLAH